MPMTRRPFGDHRRVWRSGQMRWRGASTATSGSSSARGLSVLSVTAAPQTSCPSRVKLSRRMWIGRHPGLALGTGDHPLARQAVPRTVRNHLTGGRQILEGLGSDRDLPYDPLVAVLGAAENLRWHG